MSCPPDKIVTDYANGIVVCTEDGVVIDVVYDNSPPRAYEPEEYSKIGFSPINPVYHDYGIHTEIGSFNNSELTIEQIDRIERMRSLNNKLRFTKSSKRYVAVVKNAREILSRLGISSLLPDVASLMRQISRRASCRTNRTLAAALVYIVCRIKGVPRTLQDVADAASLSKDEVGKCYRGLVEKMNLKPQPHSPASFVPKVSSQLGLPGEVSALAIALIHAVHERCDGFQGNDPVGVAAGAVYVAAMLHGKYVPQMIIAKKIGVSEATIRARYRDIASCLERYGVRVPEP